MSEIEELQKWIFESPDNGKTVTRRSVSKHNEDHKELSLDEGHWLTITELRTIGKQHIHESAMRTRYPQLMELWNSYQTMLSLLRDDDNANQ